MPNPDRGEVDASFWPVVQVLGVEDLLIVAEVSYSLSLSSVPRRLSADAPHDAQTSLSPLGRVLLISRFPIMLVRFVESSPLRRQLLTSRPAHRASPPSSSNRSASPASAIPRSTRAT